MTAQTPRPTRRCCGWRTSTPTCGHPPSRSSTPAARSTTTRPTATCRSRGTSTCADRGGRPGQPAQRARVRPGARVRQRRRRAQRHPQRPPGHHRAGRRGRAVRPDLRRAGQPDPAGRAPCRCTSPPSRRRTAGAPTPTSSPRRSVRVPPRCCSWGPSMPTGAVFDRSHLDALAGPVAEHGAWILYDAAMERIRFDDRPPVHPASHPELAERVITVGSASKELRMIGWRVGWVVAPGRSSRHRAGRDDQRGLPGRPRPGRGRRRPRRSRRGRRCRRRHPHLAATRCELVLDQLAAYPVVRPHGGWSLLVDTTQLGLAPAEASQRLFERGRVAATPMGGWGPSGEQVPAAGVRQRARRAAPRPARAVRGGALTTSVVSRERPEGAARFTYPAISGTSDGGCVWVARW